MRATCNPDPDSFVRRLIDWWIGPDGYPIKERSGVIRWFVRDEAGALRWFDTKEAAYEATGRSAEAKKQVETLMSTTPDPKYMAEHKQAVEDAKKLLEKINRG